MPEMREDFESVVEIVRAANGTSFRLVAPTQINFNGREKIDYTVCCNYICYSHRSDI